MTAKTRIYLHPDASDWPVEAKTPEDAAFFLDLLIKSQKRWRSLKKRMISGTLFCRPAEPADAPMEDSDLAA